jgi:hypothetical protein
MTTYFRTKVEPNIGTTPVAILTATPTSIYTLIGLSLANITDNDVIIDVTITDSSENTGFFIKQLIIPPYTSAKLVQQGEKIILGNNAYLTIVSDTATSVDAIASYAEIA